jgi:hypothetical protein
MPLEGTTCRKCNGTYSFNSYCGAFVCDKCGDHHGLGQCFCGWNNRKVDPESRYQEQW